MGGDEDAILLIACSLVASAGSAQAGG